MSGDELQLVQWLASQPQHARLKLGIGDDMAVVATSGGSPLFASDMLLDGVHFDSDKHPLELVGRKALACNLSDCAAMAVRPLAVTVSIALPPRLNVGDAESVYEGVYRLAAEFDVAVAGGDTNRWEHPLAIDVAILAEPWPGCQPVTRTDAQAGDRLYVTGKLGGSLLGRHLTFAPRIREARILAEKLGERLHAMMDISDGLSLDLWRMCQASHTGAILDEGLLEPVISEDARTQSREDGKPPLEHALSDGEDFELLLAISGEPGDLPFPVLPVGQMVTDGFSIRRCNGALEPLMPKGYVH